MWKILENESFLVWIFNFGAFGLCVINEILLKNGNWMQVCDAELVLHFKGDKTKD